MYHSAFIPENKTGFACGYETAGETVVSSITHLKLDPKHPLYKELKNGQLADMVFTDPPCNVDYANPEKDGKAKKDRRIKNDNLGADFHAFLLAAMTSMLTVSKGAIYVCMSSSELDTLQRAFRDAGGKWSTFLIWARNTFTLGRADYQRQYEPILYCWKEGTDHFWCGVCDQGDVWFFNKPVKNDLHPTMKPVELVERAVCNGAGDPL